LVYHAEAYEKLGQRNNSIQFMGFLDNEAQSVLSERGKAVLAEAGKEIWGYYTRTSHLWIDAPGLSNRFWGAKAWANGLKGLAIWGINYWWQGDEDNTFSTDPWKQPYYTWGNGSLSYFYPPIRDQLTGCPYLEDIVPSVRLILTRDGIEDYEYVTLLASLKQRYPSGTEQRADIDRLLQRYRDFFPNPEHWRLNIVGWYLLRRDMAKAIVRYQGE